MNNNETSTIEDDTTSEDSAESDIGPLWIAYAFLVSVAGVLCLIVILSMTIPLLYPRRRKNYSVYNLYLAYLALSDLCLKSFVLHLMINYDKWPKGEANFIDHPFDHAIIIFCTSANLYMNAFVAYEIYSLLRNSSRMIKHTPPSIRKVTAQAIVSYGIGIFYCLIDHFVIKDRLDVGSKTTSTEAQAIIVAATLFLCAGIPMIVVVGVCVQVHRLRLIGTTRSMFGGRLRTLTLYFARIVCIYTLVWLPAFVSYTIYWSPVGWMSDTQKRVALKISMVLVLLQVFVSFGFSWTKPDAKTLFLDFFKFQYCRECVYGGEYSDSDVENFEWDPEAHPRRQRSSTRFMPSDSFLRRGK